jgi:hypothetical protein
MPTKAEVEASLTQHSLQTKERLERGEKFALQMERITDAEFVSLGFTQDQVNYIRSQNTALKYLSKYYRKDDVSAYADNPSYFIEYFLNIKAF